MDGVAELRKPLRVESAAAARVLVDPKEQRLLAPFFGQERSVTAAAALLAVDAGRLLHRVRRYEKLGLVGVGRLERRAGRPIKHYRAVADEFFVPYAATPGGGPLAAFLEIDDRWRRRFLSALADALERPGVGREEPGLLVFAHHGQVRSRVADKAGRPLALLGPDSPAAFSGWFAFRLDFEDAKVFQRELADLAARYAERRGAQLYLARLGLAPAAEFQDDALRP